MGIVQDLRKGNQTLSEKIDNLEEINILLKKEIQSLRIENYDLRCKIQELEGANKSLKESPLGALGIYGQLGARR